MKLLICASEYYPHGAGIGNVAYYIVSQLQKMGVSCTACSPTGPDIKLGSSSMIAKYGRLGLLYYWYQVSRYFRQRHENYDVVWLHNPLFIQNNPLQKSLITIHTTSHEKTISKSCPLYLHIYYKASSIIEKHCLTRNGLSNARFTAVSPHVLEELIEIGIEQERITYIPNGVDTGRFKPSTNKKELRKKFDLPENELILLSMGKIAERKEPNKLIEVFSLIENSMKYGIFKSPQDKVVAEILIDEKTVTAEVINPIDTNVFKHLRRLDRTIQWVRGYQDPFEAYVERLKDVSKKPLSDEESGLGLTRIAYEGKAIVDFFLSEENLLNVSAVSNS